MNKFLSLMVGVIFLVSCNSNLQQDFIPTFKENHLSFSHLRWRYDTTDKWIKKPENILMIHETFKKIGYENLITQDDINTNPFLNQVVYVNRSLKETIDSLVITFGNKKIRSKYYREFWERRKKEKNDKVVFQVLSEVKSILFNKLKPNHINESVVNDTLFNLLSFEYPGREPTAAEAEKQLKYLVKIGLHQSAYHLRSGETYQYHHIKWENSLVEIITQLDTNRTFETPWFIDNSP